MKNRTAQLSIVIGFLALYLLFQHPYFLYIAFGLGLLSLLSKTIGDKIVWGWFKIIHAIGWINSRIILTLVFFLVLMPTALLSRLFGKQHLDIHANKPNRDTHYITREHEYTKADLEEMW